MAERRLIDKDELLKELGITDEDCHGAEVLSDYCGVCGAEMEKA